MQQQDECETDSGTKRDDEADFEVVSKTSLTKSGRAVRAFVRLDFLKSALFDGYMLYFNCTYSEHQLIAIIYPPLDNNIISFNREVKHDVYGKRLANGKNETFAVCLQLPVQ